MNALISALFALVTTISPFEPVDRPVVVESSAQWACQPEQWTSGPGLVNGQFRGTLTTDCVVTGATREGLLSLENFWLGEIKRAAQVHKGPVEETYRGLPSVMYDVTVEYPTDEKPVRIRQNAHVATDKKTRTLYSTESTKIQGPGMASYLRKLDVAIETWPMSDKGGYLVRLTNTVHIDKPWYAPGGVFKNEAEQAAKEQFIKIMGDIMPQISSSL